MVKFISLSRFSILVILFAHKYNFCTLTNLSKFLISVIRLKLKSKILHRNSKITPINNNKNVPKYSNQIKCYFNTNSKFTRLSRFSISVIWLSYNSSSTRPVNVSKFSIFLSKFHRKNNRSNFTIRSRCSIFPILA